MLNALRHVVAKILHGLKGFPGEHETKIMIVMTLMLMITTMPIPKSMTLMLMMTTMLMVIWEKKKKMLMTTIMTIIIMSTTMK